MFCKICNKEVKNLGLHIAQAHKNKITTKEYYDKYLKQSDEGICPVCGKITSFISFSKGYAECCSIQCSSKNPNRQKKIKETLLKTKGVTNAFQISEVKNKAKKNSHTPEAINKMLSTKKDHLGYSSPFENPEIQRKANKQSHTIEANTKRLNTFHTTLDNFEIEHNCTRTTKLITEYGQGWLKIKDNLTILNFGQYSYVLNSDLDKIIEYASTEHWFKGQSKIEKWLIDQIKQFYSGTIIENTRDIIKPFELDIYFPDKKVGIEVNGARWHSDEFKPKNYHLEKSKLCEQLGIRLIHIYEWELQPQYWEKIKSLLQIALGCVSSKIYARNCEIRKISNNEAKDFNELNHLQGHRNAQITYGLFYNNNLVQLMSFSKTKYNKNLKSNNDWEIIRGCPGSNNIVIGGVDKLFKYFIKENHPDKIFSYCDFNKFDGISYEKIGMQFIGYTGPDKTWLLPNYIPAKRNPYKYKELKNKAIAIMWGAGSKKYEWRSRTE